MDTLLNLLPKSEQVPLRLRFLYENTGYLKYHMANFEPYELYIENKQFLRDEGILTFTDTTGRLMALKPDITMSMVKNANDDGSCEKYYYNENVFRAEHRGQGYQEIHQMGIEFFGASSGYDEAEVIALAVDTMATIHDTYKLDINHMGFVSGFVSSLCIGEKEKEAVISALRNKNTCMLTALSTQLHLSLEQRQLLMEITSLRTSLGEGLKQAAAWVQNDEMHRAFCELEEIFYILSNLNKAHALSLDFSVINDLDYYNGLVFRGYVKEVPRAVLAGGRYDKLMHRFGKSQGAVGFALYLSALDRLLYEAPSYHVDTILLTNGQSSAAIAAAVSQLQQKGQSVRVQAEIPPQIRARNVMMLTDQGTLEEVSVHA